MTRLPLLRALIFSIGLSALLLPASALAGENYTTSAWTDCGNSTGGGQYDEQRTFYIACNTSVLMHKGDVKTMLPMGVAVQDVAPSPDGAFLYVVAGAKFYRYDRDAAGAYTRNAAWTLPNITANGWTFAPRVIAVGTDARGNIYASHAAPADSVISKHAPDGTLITAFGGFTNTTKLGEFYLNRGVAPSRDGRYIYVVEKTGGVIERWDYQPDGSYLPTQQWGRYTPAGSCINGEFGAPGDAVVDPWGFVYIMDTTCARIQKFTADGRWIWSKTVTIKSHRLGVDSYGSIFTAEGAMKQLIRADGDTPTAAMPALQPLPQPPYAATAREICPIEDWTNGAGQAAKDGTVYVACGQSIYAAESNGTQLGRIALPAGAHYYDVAPSPDETYLYVTRRVDAQGRGELVRLVRRGAAGSLIYDLDAQWKLADIQLGGRAWKPQGQYVATDAWGDIYFSNGGWSGYYTGAWDGDFQWEAAPALIVKYDPAGAIKTQFMGDKLGEFDVNMGITVSRDGRTVYTVEHKAGRVQRFDYTATGEYRQTNATFTFGATDPTCAQAGGLSTPYDLGVDPWGELWVSNTGCKRADKYTAGGALIYSVALEGLNHGIAVDIRGNAWIGQRNSYIARSAQNPVPGPLPALLPLEAADDAGPDLTDIILPAIATTRPFVAQIRATDASAITGMRLATEAGNWGAWLPYTADATITSSAGFGPKGVYLQLRDEHGHNSAIIYRTYQYQAIVDLTAPVLDTVTLPNPAATRNTIVTTTGTDDTGITQMRIANEDGNWSAWVAYTPNKAHTLSASASTFKGVYVQVRDGAGRESNVIYRATRLAA